MGARSPSSATSARPALLMGCERVVADLAAGERRHRLVEERHERPGQAALGLAPLAEQDQVLAGQERVLDLGQDGLVEADDAGEDALAALELPDEVLADLGLDGARRVACLTKLADGSRLRHTRDLTMRRVPPSCQRDGPPMRARCDATSPSHRARTIGEGRAAYDRRCGRPLCFAGRPFPAVAGRSVSPRNIPPTSRPIPMKVRWFRGNSRATCVKLRKNSHCKPSR